MPVDVINISVYELTTHQIKKSVDRISTGTEKMESEYTIDAETEDVVEPVARNKPRPYGSRKKFK